MKKFKRVISMALTLCMAGSLIMSNPQLSYAAEEEPAVTDEAVKEAGEGQKVEFEELSADDVVTDELRKDTDSDEVIEQAIDSDGSVKVIIVMEGDSVVEANAAAELDDETAEEMSDLEDYQADVIESIEEEALGGESLEISYQYTWLVNGVAATVPYRAIEDIKAVDGVKQVLLQPVYEVCETDTDAVTDIAWPMTISDGEMIGRESAWANGYRGEGLTIAIIDTGLDIDHQNFGALSEDIQVSATKDTVAGVLGSLNASERYAGLTADDVYHNTKVAYGFNYCDNNLDVTHDNDSQGDHGTHVAGIAAANQVESSDAIGSKVVGVAPDAQLYVMKVFGQNGGAYTEDILAALEDAMILGADVANLSLGSPAGFTRDGEEIDKIYDRASETGIILAIAGGNAYTSGYGNAWGTNENLTENPDNATISSPATYANVLSVASMENAYYPSECLSVNGKYIAYAEGSNASNDSMNSLTGQSLEIVAVPGSGAPEDYEGLDVSGKIALVQRGTISFGDKCSNAAAAGAAACLIYNNTTGTISMDLTGCTATIPCASITMEDGNFIIAALEADPDTTATFEEGQQLIASTEASRMSDFSSWGVSPDLSLEPDITAPGGNIYSTTDDGTYGLMSGTSMASPNLAGMSALVSEYVQENYGYTGAELHNMVKNLLMSTSAPLSYSDTLLYSPRQQGSGLANVYNAVTTQAYLTVDGADTPKAELRDDPNKTGSYSYSFNVNNFGSQPLFYTMNTVAQTEEVDTAYADYGYYFMAGAPRALAAATGESTDAMALTYDVNDSGAADSHDAYLIYQAAVKGNPEDENWQDVSFRYNTDGNETVDADDVQAYLDALVGNDSPADLTEEVMMVAAGETATVNVSVTLDGSDKSYFDTYYKNGCYVEGFTMLTALNSNGVDLSLPYLAFFGDWTDADVLDSGFWYEDENEIEYSQYPHVLLTQYVYNGEDYSVSPGENPYAMIEEDFDINHISLSPNNDGYADYICDVYVSLLRNADKLTFTYTDPDRTRVYSEEVIEHASKSVYYSSYGQIIPYVYSWDGGTGYDLTDENGEVLPNNTRLLLTISASLDYEGAPADTIEFPVTVDTEKPELLDAEISVGDDGSRKLTMTFRDNVSVSGVNMLNQMGLVYGQYGVEDVEFGEDGYQTYTQTYDVTNCPDKLIVLIGDYAYNEAIYALNLNGAGNDYGDLVGFRYDEYGGNGTWVSFNSDVNSDEVEVFVSEQEFVCAEYVNGIVFAETEDGKLYGFPYEDMLADTYQLTATYITTLNDVYSDFAYSYADGKLYGICNDGGSGSVINSINLNGRYWDDNSWEWIEPYAEVWETSRGDLYGLTLACDDEGALYVIGTVEDEETGEDSCAQLWKAAWVEDDWGYKSLMFDREPVGDVIVGEIAKNINYRQSAAWNHNTEKLYWAQFYPTDMIHFETDLIEVEPATGQGTKVGELSGETGCLFAHMSEETAAKEEHQNVPEFDREVAGTPTMNKATMVLSLGASETLSCSFDPWYTSYTALTWSSDDEAVAIVDQNGKVTAVGEGSCTITAASVKDPSMTTECKVTVTSLDLNLSGISSISKGGINNVSDSCFYTFDMVDGQGSTTLGAAITASDDLDFGLQIGSSTLAKGSIWACEWGNTGMIYQIDPVSGEVQDTLMPIDGDMLYGLTYSENTGLFTGIMNYQLYVDMGLTHEEEKDIIDSYDEDSGEFTWHKLDLSSYLDASDKNFATGESYNGSIVDVVLCGITTIDSNYTYENTYKNYLGNWAYDQVVYTADVTYVLLDNVGRLWYMDEIMGLQMDEFGEGYCNADQSDYISTSRDGVLSLDNGDGTYNVFYLREIKETPLTDMYRAGTMPRYTYHFSDLYYAGIAEDGSDVFFMSLYDYWNDGVTNQLYLYISGTTQMNEETWEEETAGQMLYDLGTTGEGNIIATINSAKVTGGLDITKPAASGRTPVEEIPTEDEMTEESDTPESVVSEESEAPETAAPAESESETPETQTPAESEAAETEAPAESEPVEAAAPAESEAVEE